MKFEFSTTPYSLASAAMIAVVVQAVEVVSKLSGAVITGWTLPSGYAAPMTGIGVFVLLEAVGWLMSPLE